MKKPDKDKLEHVRELLERSTKARLFGMDVLRKYKDVEAVAAAYNGIGPEWMGEKLRESVTRHLALFEPAALLHNLAFEQSDGTFYGFTLANGNFYQDCLRLADEGFKWLDTGTHTVYTAARILYFCVSSPFGWMTWRKNFVKRGNARRKENPSET